MKIAVYPGSFSPFHKGHEQIVKSALQVFDHIAIAVGNNPNKNSEASIEQIKRFMIGYSNHVSVQKFNGLFVDFIKNKNFSAVVKGLRNQTDFQYEQIHQYWNEDLGLHLPVFYVIADRNLVHISSSAIRSIEDVQKRSASTD